jgi:hypothetical protein
MISLTTLSILCWHSNLISRLEIFPFVFRKDINEDSTEGFTYRLEYVGISKRKSCLRNMQFSFAVQALLNLYLILQAYFNYVDTSKLILSGALSVTFLLVFSSQVLWWTRLEPLILLVNNFLEFNAYLGNCILKNMISCYKISCTCPSTRCEFGQFLIPGFGFGFGFLSDFGITRFRSRTPIYEFVGKTTKYR